jgi:ABC-type nitrate/sulfonate/bicarbonate transport system substrate-binding protein
MPTYDTIWFTRCPVPTATGIAADLGWLDGEFAPDGIAVRSLQDASRDEAANYHFTHALAGLFREGGNVPALWARSRGEATRLIGLTWIEERQVIHVRADSQISEPGQLKGARLAIPRHEIDIDFWRAMALHGFAGALGLAGLTLGDAELVEVPASLSREDRDQTGRPIADVTAAGPAADRTPGNRAPDNRTPDNRTPDNRTPGQWEAELAALARGEVDAVYTKGAVAVETAQRYGTRVAIELDATPDKRLRINNGTPRPITVHQSLLDDRPDIVVRFLTVLDRAAKWAAGNPDEVARILAAETGAGAAGVAGAYSVGPGRFRDLHIDLSPERLDLLAEQELFLRSHGFIDTPVRISTWADHAPLHAALQESTR